MDGIQKIDVALQSLVVIETQNEVLALCGVDLEDGAFGAASIEENFKKLKGHDRVLQDLSEPTRQTVERLEKILVELASSSDEWDDMHQYPRICRPSITVPMVFCRVARVLISSWVSTARVWL